MAQYKDQVIQNKVHFYVHDYELRQTIGQASGLATLDANGNVPDAQLKNAKGVIPVNPTSTTGINIWIET